MKFGTMNFTLKNIKSFIQGNTRMISDRLGIKCLELDEHIKEQIVFRESVANPECKLGSLCKCGCPIPDLFYADKTCEEECYPEIMNKQEWESFKSKLEELGIVGKHPLPRIWKTNTTIPLVMPILSNINFGTIKNSGPESKVSVNVSYFNNTTVRKRLKTVSTSCGCTHVAQSLTLEPMSEGKLTFTIDGSKRKIGDANIVTTVTWDDNTSTQVTLSGKVEEVQVPPFTIYLDAGHGGVDSNGKYTTAPSKMFNHRRGTFHAGSVFYEGVSNRLSLSLVKPLLESNGFRVVVVSEDVRDTPLTERTNRANADFRNGGRPGLLVSFHSNAVAAENAGRARGFCVFTSVGNTRSDEVATVMYEEYQKQFPGSRVLTQMSDGDPDFEANFHMLTQSAMPAILIENLFFDNFDDATLLVNNNYQSQFAQVVLRTCIRARNIEYGIR